MSALGDDSTMTDDLVTWLRAQIDEDERVAHAVADHRQRRGELRWTQTDPDRTPGLIGDECGNVVTYDEGRPNEWQAAHIVRWNPARVLAEVDADRRILDLYEQTEFGDFARRTALEEVIRVRALPYADRPGYRDEWRP